MKKKFTNKLSNAVEPAAPASVWDSVIPGKGKPITKTKKKIVKKEN